MEKTVTRIVRCLLASLAMVAGQSAADAQVVNASYRPMSKSEAILGGAPSAMEALLALQSGKPAGPRANQAFAPASPGAFYRHAIVTHDQSPVSADRPDIFNSVALSISRSPLDARWSRVAGAGTGSVAGAFAASLRDHSIIAKVEAVNAYVNARVRFVDDSVQFGVGDRWLAATETLGRGRGDCEDYAIAKRAMLRAAGVADNDLYLVVLKDLTRRADHAVLVVRAAGRFLVLDNGTDRIVDSANVRDYRPILTFTAGRTFTHGYRRNVAPTVTYASNSIAAPVTLADARFEPASGTIELPDVVRDSVSLMPTRVSL